MSDCCESASGQVVSGNPLTSPRDRDIFSLEQENTVCCYSTQKKKWSHTRRFGEKTFYDCHICRSCLREDLCSSDKLMSLLLRSSAWKIVG